MYLYDLHPVRLSLPNTRVLHQMGTHAPGFFLIDFAVTTEIKFCNLIGLRGGGWQFMGCTHMSIYSVKSTVFRFSIFSCIQKEMLESQLAKVCASELTGVAFPICF